MWIVIYAPGAEFVSIPVLKMFCVSIRRKKMTRALFVCTPAESRRLIAKAVVKMKEVLYALQQSNMLIPHGPLNIYILEELLGKERLSQLMDPSTYATGRITQGITCVSASGRNTPMALLKRG